MAGQTTLWDRDEPRYARASVEMVESGDYFIPTFNDELRPHKPIMVYWLMSVPIHVLGKTAFAARVAPAVCTVVNCLLMFYIGKWIYDARAGWWAMLITASSFMVAYVGTSALCDAPLLLFMTANVAVFVHAWKRGIQWYHCPLMGFMLGGALLSKGPIAYIAMLTILLCLWFARKRIDRPGAHFFTALLAIIIGTGLFLAWAIPANNATGGEFAKSGIGKHLIHRMLHPMESHGGHFLMYLPYYPAVVAAGFLPWTLVFPGSLSAVFGGRTGGRDMRLLFNCWFWPVLIIMTVVATKLPHYIYFIMPSLSLAVAGTVRGYETGSLSGRDWAWLRHGIWLAVIIVVPLFAGFLIGPFYFPIEGLVSASIITGLVFMVPFVWAIAMIWKKRLKMSAVMLVVTAVALVLPLYGAVLPVVDTTKLSPEIAKIVKSEVPESYNAGAFGFKEPSLVFYIERRVAEINGGKKGIRNWIKEHEPCVLIIPEEILELFKEQDSKFGLMEVGKVTGVNYVKGKEFDIYILASSGEGA